MPFGRVPSVLSARCSLRAGGVDRCWVASLSCHAGSARSRTSLSLLCGRARVSRNASGTLRGSNGGAIRRPQVFVMNLRGTTSERASRNSRSQRPFPGNANTCIPWRYAEIKSVISAISCRSRRAPFDGSLSSCLLRCPLSLWSVISSRGEESQGLNTGACTRAYLKDSEDFAMFFRQNSTWMYLQHDRL